MVVYILERYSVNCCLIECSLYDSIQAFINSSNIWLSTYYVPCTVPVTGDINNEEGGVEEEEREEKEEEEEGGGVGGRRRSGHLSRPQLVL